MAWRKLMVLTLLVGAVPAASAASAVAYDQNGNYGYSMNRDSVTAAMQQALEYCARSSRNCGQFASTVEQGYSAIFTGTVALGYALGEKTPEAAQKKAEKMCSERANDCTLQLMWRERGQAVPRPPSHPIYAPPQPPEPVHP